MIFERKKNSNFCTGITQKLGQYHFTQESHRKCTCPWFCTGFARAKNLVFCKYLRNEMRYAKMKSFRLNRILRRMFEQSFEEIGEPFVVGRSVGRRTVVGRSVGNTVPHL